ncbi:MAG: monovalent cation/H+ antiporter complex subunit F [Bacillota bacterium]|jgi:multicomponent Na+:H+ antiporter subunit F
MLWLLIGLMILILFVLLRAIIGPTVIDRLLSINAISTKVSVIILLMAFIRDDYGFIDVAFVFVLCGFVGGLWILRVMTPGDWQLRLPGLGGFEGEGEEAASND